MNKYMYVLIGTEQCNYNCSYCEHKDLKKDMSIETFNELFEEIMAKSEKDDLVSFSFFGGEPLLNFKLIKHVLKTCKEHEGKRNFENSIVTNLSILTDEMIDTFNEYEGLVKVGVSIDGPEKIYEMNKSGSFDNVVDNYYKLKERTNLNPGVSMVIDRRYLDKIYNNFFYLYNELDFRNFSMFLNLNDWEFLSDKKYARILKKEMRKINDFILENYDRLQKVKFERYRLDEPDYLEDIVCDLDNVKYVGITGNKFNCTRYKYAKGEKIHEHIDWDKCENCDYKAYCCSCWGNNSFLYEGIDNPEIYQRNYCYLMSTLIEETFRHWEKLKEVKKGRFNMIYKKGKEYLMLVNPKRVDSENDKLYILVDRIPEFEIETDSDIIVMIEISPINVQKINEIIDYCLRQGINRFEFRFKDYASWKIETLEEYRSQLNSSIEKMKEKGVFSISPIDNILFQREVRFTETFIKDEKEYIDPSLKYAAEDMDFSDNVPLCEDCKFNHCHFNPLENKEITNETIIPSIEQCEKAKIEGKVALDFYDTFIS